jgi:dyslexia susceptibility 1 candidate gene 1 protein
LKEKGDEFVKNKDFYSAINAYNSAHRLDENMLSVLMNRALC